MPGAGELAKALRDAAAWKRARAVSLAPTWRWVAEEAREVGVRVAVMKAAAPHRWYDDATERNLNDLDLWMDDSGPAWKMTEILCDRGWRFNLNELPWVKSTQDGRAYGVINTLPLRLRAVRFIGSPHAGAVGRRPWRCLRLVPVDVAARLARTTVALAGRTARARSDDLVVVRCRGVAIAWVGGNVFLPTVYGRMARRRVRRVINGLTDGWL